MRKSQFYKFFYETFRQHLWNMYLSKHVDKMDFLKKLQYFAGRVPNFEQ